MDKDELELELERKKFLEEQQQWCKEQDSILEQIEIKLHDMKKIAQYALNHELTEIEIDQLNVQINELKSEIHYLENQLHSVVN